MDNTVAQEINAFQPRYRNVAERFRPVSPIAEHATYDEAHPVISFQQNLAANHVSHPIISSYQSNSALTRQPTPNHPIIYPNTFDTACQIPSDVIFTNQTNTGHPHPFIPSSHNQHLNSTYPLTTRLASAQQLHSQSSSYPIAHVPPPTSVFTAASIAPLAPLPLYSKPNQTNTQKTDLARSFLFCPSVFTGKECPR